MFAFAGAQSRVKVIIDIHFPLVGLLVIPISACYFHRDVIEAAEILMRSDVFDRVPKSYALFPAAGRSEFDMRYFNT